MWVSDRHPDRDRLLARANAVEAPPEPAGETLAKFVRDDLGKGRRVLRVSWESFEGRPFARLAFWVKTKAGTWVPLKGSISIRVGELPGVVAALQDALGRMAAAQAQPRADDPPTYAERRRSRPAFDPSNLPPATTTGGEPFDEFEEPSYA